MPMHSGPECTTRENAFMVGHNFVKVNFNGRINVSYKCCTTPGLLGLKHTLGCK